MKQAIDREFVRIALNMGERHVHRPEVTIRYNLATCLCGGVVKESYGGWKELTRWQYWSYRRFWVQEPPQ